MKKYLTKFSTRAAYEAELSNLDFPNVSYVDGEEGVIFNAEMPLIVDNKISGTHTGDDIMLTFEIGYGVDGKKSETVELPVTGETWEYEWTIDTFSWIGSWQVSPYTAAKMSAPMLKSPAQLVYTITLDHFGLDTSECTSVNNWFGPSPFSSINISGLDVSSADEMQQTFENAFVESIDMSGIDMTSITRLSGLFENSDLLRTINMDGTILNTEKGKKGYTLNVDDMFNGVPSDVSISLRNSDQGTLEILQGVLIFTGNCYDATIDTGDLIWTYNQSTGEWEGNPHKG